MDNSACDQCPVPILLKQVRRAHRFLAQQSFYAVVLSSLLACALWAARAWRSDYWGNYGLIWNLFLAWLPYLCSLGMVWLHRRHPRGWWLLVIPAGLWLAFFPNAPYIVTDLWHLRERPPIPFWFDLGFFVTFAWTGCFLGIASLRSMQTVVQDYVGKAGGWLFTLIILTATGFGIYLGRFERWNSWDLVMNPRAILYDIAAWLIHPRANLRAYAFSFLFAAILFVCYLTFTSAQQRDQN